MKILIMGSGLLGVTTAYYLNELGYDVTVIDRQANPGAETSFANGGQISVSHAEPWANPSAPLKVLKWLGQENAPLLFRLRFDINQWLWGLKFLRECSPSRTNYNIEQIVNLGTYSRESLRDLREKLNLEYDQKEKGILHFYTSEKEFEGSIEPTKKMQELGCNRKIITTEEAVLIEPALKSFSDKIIGATYTSEDESGDANAFVRELAKVCKENGVKFLFGHNVTAIRKSGDTIEYIEATNDNGAFVKLKADKYVVAMGSYSPVLLRSVGINLPIYPAKGYSATMPVRDASLAYNVSLTDDEYKLVFSRLGDRLRIAGTAELNGYNRELNQVRCDAIVKRTQELFPGAGDIDNVSFWTGLRPATPSNLPIIGKSMYDNLYLNTGHGTLGWTHACGSGKSIAKIIAGQKPDVNFAFKGV